jgi:hypothetical protein
MKNGTAQREAVCASVEEVVKNPDIPPKIFST